MDGLVDTVKQAVTLHPGIYEKIGSSPRSTRRAIVIAVAAVLVGGAGTLVEGDFRSWLQGGLLAPLVLAVSAGTFLLVARLFKATGGFLKMFRALGFAASPLALGVVPVMGFPVGFGWMVLLSIRAVKETQQVAYGAAAATVLLPTIVIVSLGLVARLVAGPTR